MTVEEAAKDSEREVYRTICQLLCTLAKQVGVACGTLPKFVPHTDDQRRAYEAVRAWCMEPNGNLVLAGGVGAGKDTLAYQACLYLIKNRQWRVQWVNGRSLMTEFRDRISEGVDEKSFIDRFVRPSVLWLSDPLPPFGTLTCYQADVLYQIADKRARKISIVTINVDTDQEADQRLGAPTWDRWSGNATKVWCKWPSFRKELLVVGK